MKPARIPKRKTPPAPPEILELARLIARLTAAEHTRAASEPVAEEK